MHSYLKIFLAACFILLSMDIRAQETPSNTDTTIINTNVISPQSITLQDFSIEPTTAGFILKADDKNGLAKIEVNGEEKEVLFTNGQANMDLQASPAGELIYMTSHDGATKKSRLYHLSSIDNKHRAKHIPLWLSLLPPLIAIILALIFKEVIISLFIGIFSGAFIASGMRLDSLYYFVHSFFSSLTKYIINALGDSGHLSVIIFSLLIGGMVAIISKNGGMAGVVKALSKYAKGRRSTQAITWLLGVAIFFDDYANTLIVGNTMRPVTDKFVISREKLAYIVDSTAAPVAAVAFITTWIGAELGYIDGGVKNIPLFEGTTPYALFISSLKYSFYPILTLIFILFLIYFDKDYGPMYKAEHRARTTGKVSPATTKSDDEPDMEDLSPVKGAPMKWWHAALPVMTVIGMTIFGLVDTGMQSLYSELIDSGAAVKNSWGSIWASTASLLEGGTGFFAKLGKLIGASDSYAALLWASLSGVIMAVVISVGSRIMSLFDTMHWMTTGFKTMMPALIILCLAWSLAITTEELHTAEYLSAALEDSINPYLIPVIIFVLSAFIAFSTGSSWSTMAILYPIAIPTAYAVCQANGMDAAITTEILLNVIATVLAASVLGDHCSPISDTTILSSLASDCNHIDHVRTQLPYALTVGSVSLACCFLSTFLGGGMLVFLGLVVVSLAIFVGVIKVFGREVRV